MRRLFVLAAARGVSLATREAGAHTTELQGGLGVASFVSTWRGDYGGGGTLQLGARYAGVFGVDVMGWEALATVDRRLDTGLTLGITGYLPLEKVHPLARLFVIHQHEEALVSVENAPFGVALGIGAGIRHRVGGGLSLGAEFPLQTRDRTTWCLTTRATAIALAGILGPSAYFGIDAALGFDLVI